MIKNLCFIVYVTTALGISAQTTLIEEEFTTSIPSTFAIVDSDGLVPALSSPVFSSAWIHYTEDGDTCAASTSYYDPTGQAQDYLITPKISLGTYTKLHWWGKSVDASYPEEYVVLISTTDSLTSSFTDTLEYILEETPTWTGRTVLFEDEGYANQDVYVAFKNISNDKYILLIDNIKVSTSESASINESNVELSVYPNPALDVLNISVDSPIKSVKVLNLLGEVVLETNESQIDVSFLEAGVFFVEVETTSGTSTRKFIKK